MPRPGAPLMGCTAPPPSSSVPWYFPFEPLDTTVQSGFSSHTCRAKCLRGLFADPVNSEEHQTGFLQALQKVPVPSKGVLQKRDSPQSFLPPMHAAYITWGMQRGVESRTCSGACLVRPNPSVEHPAPHPVPPTPQSSGISAVWLPPRATQLSMGRMVWSRQPSRCL